MKTPKKVGSMEFVYSLGKSRETITWEPIKATIYDFITLITIHQGSTTKDTHAFVPGTFLKGRRKKFNAEQIAALVYDVDGGMTKEDIFAAVAKTERLAVVYTTYSHLATETRMSLSNYVVWANNEDIDPDEDIDNDRMSEYLKSLGKGHLKNVTIVSRNKKINDVYYLEIKHDPVEKYRVVFPLEHPFQFIQASSDPKIAAELWTHTYKAIGDELGLIYDPACTDTSRLYYLPAHPEDAKEDEYFTQYFGGPLLDYRDYEVDDDVILDQAKKNIRLKNKRSKRGGGFNEAIECEDADGTTINLSRWMRDNQRKLQIQDLIENSAPDMILTNKGEKTDVVCPFEDHHSKPGGNGTLISNPQGKVPMGVYCMHASCQTRAPISFVQKMLEDGWFTINDMLAFTVNGNAKNVILATEQKHAPKVDKAVQKAGQPLAPTSAGTKIGIDERHARKNIKDTTPEQMAQQRVDDSGLARMVCDFEFGFELRDFVEQNPTLVPDIRAEITAYSLSNIPAADSYVSAYLSLRPSLEVSLEEFSRAVYESRIVKIPYTEMIKELVEAQLLNDVITVEKKRIREFYNMSQDDFNKIYHNIYTEVWGSSLPKEFLDAVEEFDRHHSKIRVTDGTHILDELASKQQVKRISQTKAGLTVQYSNQRFKYIDPQTGVEDEKNVFEYWLNDHPRHDMYQGTTFDPKNRDKGDHFNLWNGWQFKGEEGDWEMMYEHMLNVWCRGSIELFNWVMTYMSHIFQHPGDRPSTAIALIGAPGAGKSLPFELGMKRMVDPYYHAMVKKDQIFGKFSGATIKNKMVCVAEEAIFKGDARVMEEIKELISGKQISVEEKFGDTTMEPIHTRFFFISNHTHALGLDKGDRRFVILLTDNEEAQKKSKFDEMVPRLRGDPGYPDLTSAWCHALHNWNPESVNLSWSDLYHPPITDIKVFQITSSRSSEENFFYDLLINGELNFVPQEVLLEELSWDLDSDEMIVPAAQYGRIYRNYISHIDKSQFKYNVNGHIQAFEEGLGLKYNECIIQRRIKQKNTKCLRFPRRRDELLKHFETGRITKQEYGYAVIDPHRATLDDPGDVIENPKRKK